METLLDVFMKVASAKRLRKVFGGVLADRLEAASQTV